MVTVSTQLRQNPVTAIILIFITATAERRLGMYLGADDYLISPVQRRACGRSQSLCYTAVKSLEKIAGAVYCHAEDRASLGRYKVTPVLIFPTDNDKYQGTMKRF